MSLTLRARCLGHARNFLSLWSNVTQKHTSRILLFKANELVTPIQKRLISHSPVLNIYRARGSYLEEDGEEFEGIEETELDQHRKEQRTVKTGELDENWSNYGLDEELIESLEELGYSHPFEIQTKTLTPLLEGKDVIGRAATGSGKTLAFGIPIVELIMRSGRLDRGSTRKPNHPLAIVLAPTRELCLQNYRCIKELNPKVRCVPVYGGANINVQMSQMEKGVDVVLATPGRLMDLIDRRNCNLLEMKLLCLDEGDQLLNPNFRDQIESVLQLAKKQSQTLLFSATMPKVVRQLANEYLKDVEYVDIADDQEKNLKHVTHCELLMPREKMLAAVSACIRDYCRDRCIVFLSTKLMTKDVAQALNKVGHRAKALNGDLSQNSRGLIMNGFRMGKIKTLVATDVAARGLDIPEVDLVIQVDPPLNGSDYYTHRSGRTGRAGRKGFSILIHTGQYDDQMREIKDTVDMKQIEPPEISEEDSRLQSPSVLRGPVQPGSRPKRQGFGSWGGRSFGGGRDRGRSFGNSYRGGDSFRDRDSFGGRDSYRGGDSYRIRDSYRGNSNRDRGYGGQRGRRSMEEDDDMFTY